MIFTDKNDNDIIEHGEFNLYLFNKIQIMPKDHIRQA